MRNPPTHRLPGAPIALALGLLLALTGALPVAATEPVPTPDPLATPIPTPEPVVTDPALAVPAIPAVASVPVGLPSSLTIRGRGYGHGVGMSQYGARGRALAGQDTPEILAHYFPGTTWGVVDPLTAVRVQVLAAFAATATKPLRIYGRGGAWSIEGSGIAFPADTQLRVWRVSVPTAAGTRMGWQYTVTTAAGALVHTATLLESFRLVPLEPATYLQLWSKPSTYDRYRGALRVITKAKLDVVNELPLDDYLRGVVPSEMPAAWPAAALRAQAIAARSYAARRLRPAVGTFDLFDDTRSQMYRGMLAEKPATDEAVALTSGAVLMYGSTIADTYYHSAAGGATEANELAWVGSTGRIVAGPVPYLRGGPDIGPDGVPYDAAATWFSWQTAVYTPAQLGAILARDPRTAVGDLLAVDASRRAPSGRVVSLTLVGTAGTKTVSADVFRVVFNKHRPAGHPILRSNLFSLEAAPTA